MDAEIEIFLQKLPPEKQEILRGFQSPYQVQAYLDGLALYCRRTRPLPAGCDAGWAGALPGWRLCWRRSGCATWGLRR